MFRFHRVRFPDRSKGLLRTYLQATLLFTYGPGSPAAPYLIALEPKIV